MAIARTGYSASAINPGTADTGSFDITVPAGTDCLIVFVTGYESSANIFTAAGAGVTLESAAADAIVTGSDASTSAYMGAAWVFLNPTAGAGQTVAWDWAGVLADPAMFTWVAYSGIASIRQAFGNQIASGNRSTGVLTSSSGDVISVAVFGYKGSTSEASVTTWSNATEVTEWNQINVNSSDMTLAEHESTGDVTIATTALVNYNDGGIMAVIMVPAAAGGSAIPHNPMGFPFFGPLGGPL